MSNAVQNIVKTRLLAAAENGAALPAIPSAPVYGSENFAWDGFVLERHLLPPGKIGTTVMSQHCLAVPLSAKPVAIRWRLNDRPVSGAMMPNRVYFRAAGDALSSEWNETLDAVYLSVSPEAVALAHEQMHGHTHMQALPSARLYTDLHGETSDSLANIVLKLDAHIRGDRWGGRLHEETLLMTCSLRIAFDYAINRGRKVMQSSGTLPPRILDKLDDFILSNLAQKLTIDAIAAGVGLSTFYLCRTFRKTRGISLWQYVLLCRIQLAVKFMRHYPDILLVEVAAVCGFDSYTQFYVAFKKFCQTSPGFFVADAAARRK